MRIALLCATRRGLAVLSELRALRPDADIAAFSFREEPWEPPFLAATGELAATLRARFMEIPRSDTGLLAAGCENADLLLTVNWRSYVPPAIYRLPRLGAFVFHDSLLPEYRGFSPTVWAMVNGEDRTGVSLFEMSEEIDAGDIVDQVAVPIGATESIGTVTERVTGAYLDLLRRNLSALCSGGAPRRAQDHARATYSCRRLPEDNRIDWTQPTQPIFNLIRAVSAPYPGAFTYLDGRRLRVWEASRIDAPSYVGRIPGRVVSVRRGLGSVVLTGDGALLLTRVQPEEFTQPICAAEVLDRLSQTLGEDA